MSSFPPNKVIRVLAAAEESAVIEYCGGINTIEQIIGCPEDSSSDNKAFLVWFKDASNAQAARQRTSVMNLDGRPVVIEYVADTIALRTRNRNSGLLEKRRISNRSASSSLLSARLSPVVDKENRFQHVIESPLEPRANTSIHRSPRTFASTFFLREGIGADTSISSEVTASPTFRRSLITNPNARRFRQVPSRPNLKISTTHLSSVRSPASKSPSIAATPMSPAIDQTFRASPHDSYRSTFRDIKMGANTGLPISSSRTSSPFLTRARSNSSPCRNSNTSYAFPKRQSFIFEASRTPSSLSESSTERGRVLANVAGAKKLYCDSLFALKAKLLEIDKKALEHPAIVPVVLSRGEFGRVRKRSIKH